MNSIFTGKLSKFVIPYFDDIIVFSETEKEHLEHLTVVLKQLQESGLSLNKKKCNFGKSTLKILGNIVGEGFVKPDPAKVSAIHEFSAPNDVKHLRSFLGILNYCRDFIPNLADLAAPLLIS